MRGRDGYTASRAFSSGDSRSDVSATASRAASVGLAVVLVVLASFTLISSVVSSRRASQVTRSVNLNNAYHDARFHIALAESLERKYRLHASNEVRLDFSDNAQQLMTALQQIVSTSESNGALPAKDALVEFDTYQLAMNQLFAAVDNNDAEQITLVDGTRVDPTYSRIERTIVDGAQAQSLATARAIDRLHQTESMILWLTPVVFAIGFALLVLFTRAIRNYRRRIDHQALHDGLTGLPNRDLLYEQAIQALASAEPLTTWVLQRAMEQTRTWLEHGLEIPVAVNISARSLISLAFVDHVAALLAHTAVPAHLIELEVTESAIMTDPDRARLVLQKLHELGLSLAIDDFGTGYSSLAYLRTLPINVLKIDRIFIANMVTEPADLVIVRSVIELGHNLGLDVIAEGVEDAETGHELRRNNCDMGQGYHWSKPLPGAEFMAWCRKRAIPAADSPIHTS